MTSSLSISGLTLGGKARLLRLARGWRQVDVASAAKVSTEDVSDFEKDRHVSEKTMSRILFALGLDDGRASVNQSTKEKAGRPPVVFLPTVRAERQRAGLTQKEVCARTKCPVYALRRAEHGRFVSQRHADRLKGLWPDILFTPRIRRTS